MLCQKLPDCIAIDSETQAAKVLPTIPSGNQNHAILRIHASHYIEDAVSSPRLTPVVLPL